MTPAEVLSLMKEKEVKFVDLRFTDTRGKEQHVSVPSRVVDEDFFTDGKMFDGSSIAGWKGINESDMILMPDTATAVLDPFAAQTTLIVSCDVVEPSTGQLYARCPRSTAKRAEAFLKSAGMGDTAVFGPDDRAAVDRIGVGVRPNGLAYDPRRGRLLVAHVGDPAIPGSTTVAIVDESTKSRM